jgi:hypothetical protein
VGTLLRGALREVGAVARGAAVARHLTGDGRRRPVEPTGDLGVREVVGQAERDLLALGGGEPSSRHGGPPRS